MMTPSGGHGTCGEAERLVQRARQATRRPAPATATPSGADACAASLCPRSLSLPLRGARCMARAEDPRCEALAALVLRLRAPPPDEQPAPAHRSGGDDDLVARCFPRLLLRAEAARWERWLSAHAPRTERASTPPPPRHKYIATQVARLRLQHPEQQRRAEARANGGRDARLRALDEWREALGARGGVHNATLPAVPAAAATGRASAIS